MKTPSGLPPLPSAAQNTRTTVSSATALMAEVTPAGEDHGHPGLVTRRDDLVVALGATRLDHGGRACVDCALGTVSEWKESVGGNDRAGKELAGALAKSLAALLDREPD